MTRLHTYNRRKKRHVSKELWRFMQSAKRVMASQDSQVAWHLHCALMDAVEEIATTPRPDDAYRKLVAEVFAGYRDSMVNAVLGKTHWDIVYTEIGQEQVAVLNRHFNP